MFGVIPVVKLQDDTQPLNGEKPMKNEMRSEITSPGFISGVKLCCFHVQSNNRAQPKKDELFRFTSHSSSCSPFNCCLTVV